MKTAIFIIFISTFLLINLYVIVRGWQALSTTHFYQRAVYITIILSLLLALIVSMIFGYVLPLPVAKVISFIGFSYILIFFSLFISFIFVDIIRVANYFLGFLTSHMAAFRMWFLVFTIGITAIVMIVGNYKFNHPAVVNLNLKSEKPLQNKEIKIVAVSDIHLGISIDKHIFKKYVKLINEQQPDVVLLVGDISDRLMLPVIKQGMDEEFRAIKAPLGVYAINGNHEHYAETADITSKYLQNAGVVVLKDEVAIIDSALYIVGREDRSNKERKSISEIISKLDKSKPTILMDHQPYHLEEAEQNNIDLQISGHTHNGQFFPGNLIVKRMYEVAYGYYKKGKTHFYVSSGLGLWGPQYRIATQSEVVVINFQY